MQPKRTITTQADGFSTVFHATSATTLIQAARMLVEVNISLARQEISAHFPPPSPSVPRQHAHASRFRPPVR